MVECIRSHREKEKKTQLIELLSRKDFETIDFNSFIVGQ